MEFSELKFLYDSNSKNELQKKSLQQIYLPAKDRLDILNNLTQFLIQNLY